jgi:hypothetical protein
MAIVELVCELISRDLDLGAISNNNYIACDDIRAVAWLQFAHKHFCHLSAQTTQSKPCGIDLVPLLVYIGWFG